MTEFDCEGCGSHVVAIIAEAPPVHRLCATCAWICENMPGPPGTQVYDITSRPSLKRPIPEEQ